MGVVLPSHFWVPAPRPTFDNPVPNVEHRDHNLWRRKRMDVMDEPGGNSETGQVRQISSGMA